MVKEIIRDENFLSNISENADESDLQIADDLVETLKANSDNCVGLAANMIGVSKRIIAVDDDGIFLVMFNPEIIKFSGTYSAEEGCLSLNGKRSTKRYKSIKVKYQNEKMQVRIKTYTYFTAQIIQHEIDHCNGVII